MQKKAFNFPKGWKWARWLLCKRGKKQRKFMKMERWTTAAEKIQFNSHTSDARGSFSPRLELRSLLVFLWVKCATFTCIVGWFHHTLANQCCRTQQLMQTWDLCTPGDLWRMLTVGKGADSRNNTCWQNWRKQIQVGFDHIKKKKSRNESVIWVLRSFCNSGILLQRRRSSNEPNNSLVDNPLPKLMGIKEKLVSLPSVSIEHWSLTCNKQNQPNLLRFFLQQSLGEWGVRALRCRVLEVPSPARRCMVLNLHPKREPGSSQQLPHKENHHFRQLHVCSMETNRCLYFHCRDIQGGRWFWQRCPAVFC